MHLHKGKSEVFITPWN